MVTKNWDPLVLGPALAIERRPGLPCFRWKFSSGKREKELLQNKSGASRVPTSKFLAIDGLATSTVVASEITALEHEVGDHTVKRGIFVAKTVLAGRELPEVSCGIGDDIVVQFEDDSTSTIITNEDVKLGGQEAKMSKHAMLIDVQERKYVDVGVGHGCCFGSFDQKMVDAFSVRSTAYKHPRVLPDRRDNPKHRSGPSDDIICTTGVLTRIQCCEHLATSVNECLHLFSFHPPSRRP